MATSRVTPRPSPETTDLEKRVLAHEQILQSLIACMSRFEPHFIEHQNERFAEPIGMVHYENDDKDVGSHAEDFLRSVVGPGDRSAVSSSEMMAIRPRDEQSLRPLGEPVLRTIRGERVQTRERNGIWEVRVDEAFHGDYHRKEHALAAAAVARMALYHRPRAFSH